MHKKNFDTWNEVKKEIDNLENTRTYHEREIWFLKIGENVGFEQNGKWKMFLRKPQELPALSGAGMNCAP